MHRPLTEADLRSGGPLRRVGGEVRLFDQIDSTNAHLLTHADELPDGAVACAELQTAGRGRLGRAWVAPRGAGVLLSVLLHEPMASPLPALAGLLASVAACEAVETGGDVQAAVRWPNDITAAERKLGGVLVETRPAARAGQRMLVIGVGLNVLQQVGHFPPELTDKATSLELCSSRPIDRAAVAGALVRRLDAWLTRAAGGDGPAAVRRAWLERCAELGRRVALMHDGRAFSGTVLDVSDDGDLVVQLDEGGRRHFAAATSTRSG